MFSKNWRLTALVVLACFTQFACYNTYFIDKNELEKLESDVEPKEVVTIYGDCEGGGSAYNSVELDETTWAAKEKKGGEETKSDATAAGEDESATGPGRAGCEKVPVSTANPVQVVAEDGTEYRVTPFNFMMSEKQIVSPEYDLLLSLDDVKGAEVKQFSTWKTAATIVGVSLLSVGTFVGISLLAPEGEGFSQ